MNKKEAKNYLKGLMLRLVQLPTDADISELMSAVALIRLDLYAHKKALVEPITDADYMALITWMESWLYILDNPPQQLANYLRG